MIKDSRSGQVIRRSTIYFYEQSGAFLPGNMVPRAKPPRLDRRVDFNNRLVQAPTSECCFARASVACIAGLGKSGVS